MPEAKWNVIRAARDFVEIVLVLGFVAVVPPIVEQIMIRRGLSIAGPNRVVATSILFILWSLFAFVLVAFNREPIAAVGLKRPTSIVRTVLFGLLLAAIVFASVVGVEHLGFGKDRLGDMAHELKGNSILLVERVAISIFVVGFAEEFIFRGFLMTRLASLFGGTSFAWVIAVISQAALFGLSHGYQGLYGIVLTGVLGIAFGLVYILGGRNLWIVIIGHGVYDAAHAAYIAMS